MREADDQALAEMDKEREELNAKVAREAKLAHSLDGYFTDKELEHLLWELRQGDKK